MTSLVMSWTIPRRSVPTALMISFFDGSWLLFWRMVVEEKERAAEKACLWLWWSEVIKLLARSATRDATGRTIRFVAANIVRMVYFCFSRYGTFDLLVSSRSAKSIYRFYITKITMIDSSSNLKFYYVFNLLLKKRQHQDWFA
mmetsp:Transcript_25877/g.56731  ORF Transcript_25877/g.56731 Transcript_25877/m.56731 type:complete len:143 (+) Transcript_25877:3147-3575(+)